MANTEIRDETPQLYRATFEFTQDGNTLGTTDDTETLSIECGTQLPGEECFLVIKTPHGWSFNDAVDIHNLTSACQGVFELINDFAAGKVSEIHGFPPGTRIIPVPEDFEVNTPEEKPEEKPEEIAPKAPVFQTTKAVIVAHDNENGDQAIYVDGKFKGCEVAIYAHDITDAVGGPGIPFTLEQRNYDNCLEDPTESSDAAWPDTIEDLELMNTAPELGPLDLKAEDF